MGWRECGEVSDLGGAGDEAGSEASTRQSRVYRQHADMLTLAAAGERVAHSDARDQAGLEW